MNDDYNRSAWMQMLILLFIVSLCITLIVGTIWLYSIRRQSSTTPNPQIPNLPTPTQFQQLLSTPIPTATSPATNQTDTQERWVVNMLWDSYALYNNVPSDVAEFIPEGAVMQPNPPLKRYGICITPEADNPDIGEVYLFNPQTDLFTPEDQTGQTFIQATVTEEK